MNEGRKNAITDAVELIANSSKKMKQLKGANRIDDAPFELERLKYIFRKDGGEKITDEEILEEAKKIANSGKFKMTTGERKTAEQILLGILLSTIKRRDNRQVDIEEMKDNLNIGDYIPLEDASSKWEAQKGARDEVIQMINDLDNPNRARKLKDILNTVEARIESDNVIERTPEELDVLDLPDLDGLVKYLGSFNIRKNVRREAIYNYWERVEDNFQLVNDIYEELIGVFNTIGDENPDFKELEPKFEKLKDNPPMQYVVNTKAMPIFTSMNFRWLDMMQNFAEGLGFSVTNSRGKQRRRSTEPEGMDIDNPQGATTGYYPPRKDQDEQGDLTADISISRDPTEGMTARQADQYINQLFEENKEEFDRLFAATEDIERNIEPIRKKGELDPLLFFAYKENKLKTSAFDNREITRISRKLRDTRRDFIPEEDSENVQKLARAFDKMVDDFETEASRVRPRRYYALPMTPFIDKEFTTVEKDPNFSERDIYETAEKKVVNDSDRGNVEFFNALNDLAFSVKEAFGSSGKYTVQGDRKLGTARDSKDLDRSVSALSRKVYPASLNTPFMGQKPKQRELQDGLKDILERLIGAMDSYFFEPNTKQFWPEQSKPSANSLGAFKSLQRLKIESPTTRFMDRVQDESIATVKTTQINALASFTEAIRNPRANRNPQELENKASDAFKTLNALFGNADKKDNEIFIASLLYDAYAIFGMLDNEGVIKDKDFREFPPTGKDIKQLSSQYRIGYSYPFQRLDFLTDNKSFSNAMAGGITSKVGRERMEEAIKRLRNALTKKEASIPLISETQLNTYDILKKAKGEEIYYGMLNQNSPDDISYIQKNISDIPATDIIGVVESISSYDRIGKNFGISEDEVYQIKGLFR